MTCLRLKRLLVEDPVDAIVVSHKRRCLESGDAPTEVETVYKLLGTVQSKLDDISHLKNAIEQETRASSSRKGVKAYTIDAAKRCKDRNVSTRKQNRFKLVCAKRGLEDEDVAAAKSATDLEKTVKGICRLYDAVECSEGETGQKIAKCESDVITCNGTPLECENSESTDAGYVYDLYYSESLAEDHLLADPIKIEYFEPGDELCYDIEDDEAPVDADDDDSNDESNWRNDYPEEGEEFSNVYGGKGDDDFYDVSEHIAGMNMGDGECDSDSDSDVDSEDERRFGRRYARFRARTTSGLGVDDDGHSSIFTNGKSGNPFAG